MKRMLLALAVSAAAVTAVAPAVAQPYGPPGPPPAPAGMRDHDMGGYRAGRDFWRGAPTSSWERMQWMQQRIERGRADGSLNPREAKRAQRELDRTRRYIQDARRRFGELRPQDRAYVDQRLDYVRNLIRWERHNFH